MESIFSMGREVELPSYLESLIHYFGSSYICLWSYHPHPSNSLVFLAGFYQHHHLEQQQQQQQVRRHFDDYTHSSFTPLNDRVPGHAFKMNHPFVELYEPQLMRMASILPQRLFYKEAMIKTAVFMGCRSGEIEIGWSNLTPQQMRIESEMMKLFPDNFSSGMIQVAAGNQPPSSSSSSLRSPSLDNNSPEYSSFLLNLTAAFHPPNLQAVSISTSSTSSQLQQIMQLLQQPPQSTSLEAMQALAGGHESQVDAAMTRALLAVFTSPSSSNTSSAFSKFSNPTGLVASSSSRRNASMFKRALTYYRRSFMMTRRRRQIEEEEQMNNLAAASRPTSTQLHHMISERRRREKINDSFQSLRALLPPDVKKDKATVLSRTKEYLKSLITQVAQLSQRTQQLESKLLLLSPPPPPAAAAPAVSIREPPPPIPTDQRVDVRLIPVVEETTSEEQYHIVDLQVTLRDCPVSDIVIRVLQFLTQIPHVNLIALQANTETSEQHTPRFSRANFRLQIELGEWNEATFQEAVRRVVADLAQ